MGNEASKIVPSYKEIYSALYEWNLKQWSGDAETASFLTAAGLTGALMANAALIASMLVLVFGPLTPSVAKVSGVCLLALFAFANYTIFIRRDRYVEIVRRFREQTLTHKRRVTVFAWVYILSSFGLPLAFSALLIII